MANTNYASKELQFVTLHHKGEAKRNGFLIKGPLLECMCLFTKNDFLLTHDILMLEKGNIREL